MHTPHAHSFHILHPYRLCHGRIGCHSKTLRIQVVTMDEQANFPTLLSNLAISYYQPKSLYKHSFIEEAQSLTMPSLEPNPFPI